jgi:hypothetical protein
MCIPLSEHTKKRTKKAHKTLMVSDHNARM